jgi:hypothetical protein
MKTRNLLVLMLGFYLSLAGAAFAENIQGTITSVNPENKSLTITPKDQSMGLPSEINLEVKDDNSIQGLESLDALAVGDEVKVEAERRDNGNWEVKSLERSQEALAQDPAGMQFGTEAAPAASADSEAGQSATASAAY